MTRHIILWKLNESLSPEEKARVMTVNKDFIFC